MDRKKLIEKLEEICKRKGICGFCALRTFEFSCDFRHMTDEELKKAYETAFEEE